MANFFLIYIIKMLNNIIVKYKYIILLFYIKTFIV